MFDNTNVFDGSPSIILNHRPYFSIIIPCYNSRKTLGGLLESIIAQDMNDDIEVILADDCSPESYQDVVERYNKKLSIRQIRTDYNFAPGNTREKGASIAEGEWICFADHDDEFVPGTFKEIKKAIWENNEDQFVVANFYEMNPDTREVIQEMRGMRNWMHAKFYNLDNFWRKYNIHFKKDLLTHEDICVSSQINCAAVKSGKEPLCLDLFCYMWMARPTSISREKYGDRTFLEVFYRDYIESTGYTYIDQLVNNNVDVGYVYDSVLEVLLYCYFYMQGFKFHRPVDWLRDNEQHAREYFVTIKEMFGVTNTEIINYIAQDEARMYMEVKDFAHIGAGPFMETETFAQWLDKLHSDIHINRVAMSDAMHKENL